MCMHGQELWPSEVMLVQNLPIELVQSFSSKPQLVSSSTPGLLSAPEDARSHQPLYAGTTYSVLVQGQLYYGPRLSHLLLAFRLVG